MASPPKVESISISAARTPILPNVCCRTSSQCAVVGRQVAGNEEVVAFVQLLQGSTASPEDLMAHVAPQLTSYKRPSEIIILEALPATSTGKILKHKLAEALRGA